MSTGDKQIQPSAQWHSLNIGKLSIWNHSERLWNKTSAEHSWRLHSSS